MRTYLFATSASLLAVMPACAETSMSRERDAMFGALSRAERDHARAIADDVALGSVLDRDALVASVLARNPDLEAARATWRAMLLEYASATSLPDPMASYGIAPLSVGSSAAFGQRVELSQAVPWPGKRRLAGEAVTAEAEAASADYAALRLELAEAAVFAYDDLYVAARALAINQQHRALLERIERSATAQYTAGRAAQQDPLEARAEIIQVDRERLMIETQHRTATAKINRLLRRAPVAVLPPPPARLENAAGPVAAALHPRIAAARARIRARNAEIESARLAFYPDFAVMGSYDSMWEMLQHRLMIGIGIEIPLQRARRHADVARAEAEAARANAELTSVADRLDEDRARLRREVDEAALALELYEEDLLPTARVRVDTALAGYTANQNPFTTVVLAERAFRTVELQVEQARAELERRRAALARAEGRVPGGGR